MIINKERTLSLKLIIFNLILLTFIFSNPSMGTSKNSESKTINENYTNQQSLQPVAPAFSVESLLDWSPEKDPDAKLNRSSVPLNKNRFKGHQINDLANPNVGITAASITLPDHDFSSSVGGNDFNTYAFDNWQLLDSYIYWPGAPNKEGIFSLPSPDIVDAAHRNGVPVYASIGFPWGPGDPDTLEEIEDFTQQNEDGTFPVADKMIEVAEYYGFDGYFFNQETSGVSEETAKRMNEMMRYIKKNSNLRISWYDSQANDGTISYQDSVNEKNDMYVERDSEGIYGVDEFFLNYNWGTNEIDTTVSTMKKHNHSPFNAYAGFELQQNSYNTDINTEALLDENNQSKVSIALYTPNSTMGLADDPEDFHQKENYLWTGPQGDPSLADDSEDWKGMARFATDSSVIQNKPFTTNFNSGHGKKYFMDGKKVSSREWNNRSIQDIMPTWRWWIRGEGSRLIGSYDFDRAFNGGSSLKFSGKLNRNSVNDIMLYSTKLSVNDSTKVRLVYQNKPGADLSLGISYSEDYTEENMKYYSIPDSNQKWESIEIDLNEDAGKTIYAISLKVENSKEINNYEVNLGQLSIFDERESVQKVENFKIDEKMLKNSYEAEARLSWTSNENVLYYEIYQENGQNNREFLGATPNNYFYTNNISRTEKNATSDNLTTLKIIPVSKTFKRGKPTKIDFDWGLDVRATEYEQMPPPENVALNADIIDVSDENNAEPAKNALDGSSNTKWTATNKKSGYLAIDLGEEKTIRRWRVEHAESGGEEKDMNTIDFELLYKDENNKWSSAKRVKNNEEPITDIILDEPIRAREFKLHIHDSGSSPWEAIRIYEWQLFESKELPKTENIMMHFVTAENNEGDNDKVIINNVEKDQTIRLYDSLESNTPLKTKIAKSDGTLTFENLDFGEESGRIYYTVQNPNENESLKFSAGYLSEKLSVDDLLLSLHQWDNKMEIFGSDTLHALKIHLKAVKHYEDQGNHKKVVKHLEGFKSLLNNFSTKELLTDKAFQSLKKNTTIVIENLINDQ